MLHKTRFLIPALLALVTTTVESADEKAFRQCPYPTQHAAAAAILNSVNPVSIRNNQEIGGFLFYLSSGGYCFTTPVVGNHGNVNFTESSKSVPPGATATATWHTHGAAMVGVISEIFSPQDIALNQQQQLDGYLATPSGALKYLPLDSKTTQLLGTVATE